MKTGLAAVLAALIAGAAAPATAQMWLEPEAAFPGGGQHPTPPAPRPQPRPEPRPQPQPRPEPRPNPRPNPEPRPNPRPNPEPRPNPRPNPQPNPNPRPNPRPNPNPNPRPNPRPNPNPPPRPNPGPWPGPRPEPRPHPRPRPEPIPVPEPWPYPYPEPPCPGGCRQNEYFVSPDGTRAIWIQGAASDAYLYDRTGDSGFEPRWLEWDVSWVDWYSDDFGALSSFALTRYDGEVDYFDPYGERLPAPEAAPDAAPAALSVKHDIGKAFQKAGAFQSLLKSKLSW